MANVANSKATGPTSKDAVSGGKQFPVGGASPRGKGLSPMTNSSEDARRAIMGLSVSANGFGPVSESSFTKNRAPRG